MIDYHISSNLKITHITLQGTAKIKNMYIFYIIPPLLVFTTLFSYSLINHITGSVFREQVLLGQCQKVRRL
jgi:hypothetical protein